MPKHITNDRQPRILLPADDTNAALLSVEKLCATAQHSIEELRATAQRHQAEVDAMVAALRRRAAESHHTRDVGHAGRRTRAHEEARPSLPPPITAFLTGFVEALTGKLEAIAAALTPEERERLRAVAPGFTRAVLHDEPDVRAMVGLLLQMEPWWAAMILSTYLPDFERRFAP